MPEKPDKVKIKYTLSDNYRPVYVSGAYGGITTRGELVVNFYFEDLSIPEVQTFEVTEKGRIGAQVKSETESKTPQINRNIKTGIILNLESAKSIREWLDGKIKILEEREGEQNE